MAAIEYAARTYASATELKATAKAARARLMGPVLPRELGQIIPLHDNQRAEPEIVPAEPVGDDEYARLLADWYVAPAFRRRASVRQVAETTARHFEISLASLIGRCRAHEFAIPRHIAMYICVAQLGYATTVTGKFMGKFDHSTVWHGVDKVRKRIQRDALFAQQVHTLTHACVTGVDHV